MASRILNLAEKNLRTFYRAPLLAAFLLMLLTAIIMPWTGLDCAQTAKPLEMMISFEGAIFFLTILLPEQDKEIYESVFCRKFSYLKTQIVRMVISLLMLLLTVSAYALFLKANECQVNGYILFGAIASALFMGAITFFGASITGNCINGLLLGMIYFGLNVGWGNKLGAFWLFRMSKGYFDEKGWLILASLVLVIISLLINGRKSNCI